jgi:hypothetical protein
MRADRTMVRLNPRVRGRGPLTEFSGKHAPYQHADAIKPAATCKTLTAVMRVGVMRTSATAHAEGSALGQCFANYPGA